MLFRSFELNPEYQEHSHIKIWGKRIPGREDSKCKFSKARITVILRKRECGMSLENAWESSGMGEKRCRQRNGGRWSLGHFKNTDAFFRFYI